MVIDDCLRLFHVNEMRTGTIKKNEASSVLLLTIVWSRDDVSGTEWLRQKWIFQQADMLEFNVLEIEVVRDAYG